MAYDKEYNKGILSCWKCIRGNPDMLNKIVNYVKTHKFDRSIEIEDVDYKGILEELDLLTPELRKTCAECRVGSENGEYKNDIARSAFLALIIQEYLLSKTPVLPKGKGKASVCLKQYGCAVEELTKEDKSAREISKILGISTPTVTKIQRELSLR